MGHGDTRNLNPETRNPDRTGDMGMGRDIGIHEIGNPKSETRIRTGDMGMGGDMMGMAEEAMKDPEFMKMAQVRPKNAKFAPEIKKGNFRIVPLSQNGPGALQSCRICTRNRERLLQDSLGGPGTPTLTASYQKLRMANLEKSEFPNPRSPYSKPKTQDTKAKPKSPCHPELSSLYLRAS